MSYSLYVFDSDYMIDKIVALDNCTLLCSTIPRKTPKVFFTADLDKDCECDILVVKVSKRNAETFNRGDLKLRKKLAKVVIVTNTPLVSLDAYLAFGLCCSLVYMKGKEVIYSVNNFSELPEEDMSPIEVSSSPEEDNGCDLDGDKDVHIPGTVDLRLQKRSAPKGPWSSKSKAMNGGMCISPDPLQEEDFRQEIKEEVTIFSYSQGFQNVNNTVNKFLNSQEVYRRFNFLDLPSSAPTQIWEEEVPKKTSSVSDCKSRVFRHGKLAELLESDEAEEEPKTEDFDLSSSKSSSYEFGEHFSVHVDDSLFKVRKHKGMKQENPSAKKRKKGNDYRQQDETA